MNRTQCDSELVETAFTTEEVVEVTSEKIQGVDATSCAFLETAPREPEGGEQPS